MSLSDARSNPPSFSPNISSKYPPIKRPRVEEIDSAWIERVGRGWTARLESVNERDRDPAPQRPRHGRVGEERCRVARWSSITWAAHAEIDGSTCIRDNAPCRTGCSVGWLSSTPRRESPLWLQTPSPVSVHLSLRLSPSPSLPPSPPPSPAPVRSTSFTRERRAPARAPPTHRFSADFVGPVHRAPPIRSLAPLLRVPKERFLKKFCIDVDSRVSRVEGIRVVWIFRKKDFSKKIRADRFGSRFHLRPLPNGRDRDCCQPSRSNLSPLPIVHDTCSNLETNSVLPEIQRSILSPYGVFPVRNERREKQARRSSLSSSSPRPF